MLLLIPEGGGSVFGYQVDQFSMIILKRNGQSGSIFGHQVDQFSIDKNTNPIEKLWRWVRQSILHLHRLSDDWQLLKNRVMDFILSFKKGSNELLRYVGLSPG